MSESYVESWLTGPESTQFYCRTYSPASPKAVLVFLHGFIEHIGRYEHIFPQWQDRGISVFTFDLRGFGKTAEGAIQKGDSKAYGRTSGIQQLGDAEWALKHAKEQAGEIPMFLMGHSMVRSLTRTRIPISLPECRCILGRWPCSDVRHSRFIWTASAFHARPSLRCYRDCAVDTADNSTIEGHPIYWRRP